MMESLTDEIYEKGLQVINEVMETAGRDRELCSFERGKRFGFDLLRLTIHWPAKLV